MYFEYNFLNIDAIMLIPDGTQVEIQREKNLTTDNFIKITLSFEVQTYYPAFRKPTLGEITTGQFFGNYSWSAVNSDLSNQFYNDSVDPNNPGGFGNPQGGGGGTVGGGGPGGGGPGGGGGGVPSRSDILPFPKKTKWYVNLRNIVGRGAAYDNNPNSDNPPN